VRGALTRKLASNTFWLSLGAVAGNILAFVTQIGVTRYFGPTNYGIYAGIFAAISVTTVLADFGLRGWVWRELVPRPRIRRPFLGLAWGVKGIFTTLVVGITLLWYPWEEGIRAELLWPLTFYLLFQGTVQYVNSLQLIRELARSIAVTILVERSIPLIVLLLAFFLEKDMVWFAQILAVIEGIWCGVLIWILHSRQLPVPRWFMGVRRLKVVISVLSPMGLSLVVGFLSSRIDMVVMARTLHPEKLGIYAVAMTLATAPLFMASVLSASIGPAIARAWKDDKELFRDLLLEGLRLNAWAAVGIAGVVAALSKPAVHWLYGPAYLDAVWLLQLLVPLLLFQFVAAYTSQVVVIVRQQRDLLRIANWSLLVSALIIPLAIWRFDVAGAATAMVLAAWFNVFLLMQRMALIVGHQGLGRFLLAPVGGLVVLLVLIHTMQSFDLTHWLQAPIALSALVVLPMLLGGLKRRDWDRVRRLFRRERQA